MGHNDGLPVTFRMLQEIYSKLNDSDKHCLLEKEMCSLLIVVQILLIDSLNNRHCKDVLIDHLTNINTGGISLLAN